MLLFGGQIDIAFIISLGIALLVGTVFHEFMHNYVAYLMGDPTPDSQGRLTLNPMVHIYWPGFLIFLLVGFPIMPLGFAVINPNLMNYPRVRWAQNWTRFQRYAAAVAAGPIGSMLVAIFFGIVYRVLNLIVPDFLAQGGSDIIPGLGMILSTMVFWNVLLALFNLVPIAPLDGAVIFKLFIPERYHYDYDRFQAQYGLYVLFGLIMVSYLLPGFSFFTQVLVGPTQSLTIFLLGL